MVFLVLGAGLYSLKTAGCVGWDQGRGERTSLMVVVGRWDGGGVDGLGVGRKSFEKAETRTG